MNNRMTSTDSKHLGTCDGFPEFVRVKEETDDNIHTSHKVEVCLIGSNTDTNAEHVMNNESYEEVQFPIDIVEQLKQDLLGVNGSEYNMQDSENEKRIKQEKGTCSEIQDFDECLNAQKYIMLDSRRSLKFDCDNKYRDAVYENSDRVTSYLFPNIASDLLGIISSDTESKTEDPKYNYRDIDSQIKQEKTDSNRNCDPLDVCLDNYMAFQDKSEHFSINRMSRDTISSEVNINKLETTASELVVPRNCKNYIGTECNNVETYRNDSDNSSYIFPSKLSAKQISVEGEIRDKSNEKVRGTFCRKSCEMKYFLRCKKTGNSQMHSREDSSNIKGRVKSHSVEIYECKLCKTKFSNSSALKRHSRIHETRKDFQCNICGIAFADNYIWKRHIRVHTVKLYDCKICRMLFAEEDNCRNHMRIHTGKNAYQCTKCPKKFVYSDHLKQHNNSHRRETFYFQSLSNGK